MPYKFSLLRLFFHNMSIACVVGFAEFVTKYYWNRVILSASTAKYMRMLSVGFDLDKEIILGLSNIKPPQKPFSLNTTRLP